MTLIVHAGVVHQIDKQAHKTITEPPVLRGQLHTSNNNLEELVNVFEKAFHDKGSTSSSCDIFDENYTVAKILATSYFGKVSPDFLHISRDIVTQLHSRIQSDNVVSATGNQVPVLFYSKNNAEFLLVSLISLSDYLNIDQKGNIVHVDAIDNASLKVAFRINLTELEDMNTESVKSTNLPIRWLQKSRSEKLPNYIQDFIPISIAIDDTRNTTKLIEAMDAYLTAVLSTDKDNREKIRESLMGILTERANDKKPIHIGEDIDDKIEERIDVYGLAIPSFREYRQDNDIDLDVAVFCPSAEKVREKNKFNITLSEDIKVSGLIGQIGRKIKLHADKNESYLKISLSDAETENLQKNYSEITENE